VWAPVRRSKEGAFEIALAVTIDLLSRPTAVIAALLFVAL
jgi:hypothetical protein